MPVTGKAGVKALDSSHMGRSPILGHIKVNVVESLMPRASLSQLIHAAVKVSHLKPTGEQDESRFHPKESSDLSITSPGSTFVQSRSVKLV